jgi:hypothetical protein
MELQQFDIKLKYITGKQNSVADFLTRNPTVMPKCIECGKGIIKTISTNPIKESIISRIRQALKTDEWGQSIILELDRQRHISRKEEERLLVKQYEMKDGILRWNRRIYIPAGNIRTETVHRYHGLVMAAHQGATKTIEVISRYYYWPNMHEEITIYTRACLQCQRNNPANRKETGFLHPLPIPSERFQEIALDWTKIRNRNEKNNTALVIIDRLTKLTALIPTEETDTAERTAELLMENWFCRGMGLPTTITSDRDPKFQAQLWKFLMKQLGIKHNMATARHQQTDGQAENMVKQVKTALTKLFDQGDTDIPKLLPYLEYALNNSVNQTTG